VITTNLVDVWDFTNLQSPVLLTSTPIPFVDPISWSNLQGTPPVFAIGNSGSGEYILTIQASNSGVLTTQQTSPQGSVNELLGNENYLWGSFGSDGLKVYDVSQANEMARLLVTYPAVPASNGFLTTCVPLGDPTKFWSFDDNGANSGFHLYTLNTNAPSSASPLSVPAKTQHSITVEFPPTGADVTSVGLYYRRSGIKSHYTRVLLKSSTESYEITNLLSCTVYNIFWRYKVAGAGVWQKKSAIMKVKTLC